MINRSRIYFLAINLFSLVGLIFFTTCSKKEVVPKSPAPAPVVISNINSASPTGTKGVLSFNLEWSSSYNQLDLFVQGPYGSLISKNNSSSYGGNMDLICDCCSSASSSYYNGYYYENIYYASTPNSGTYSFYVRNNGGCGGTYSSSVYFTLRVYTNGFLAQSRTGYVNLNNVSSTYTYVY